MPVNINAASLGEIPIEEVSRNWSMLSGRATYGANTSGAIQCELCVRKLPPNTRWLKAHFESYHMSRKRGIASQKQLKVDKSLFDTYQMGRDGRKLIGGRASAEEDESRPCFIQKSADVMNSRLAQSPSYESVGTGRCSWDKITGWVFTSTHAKLFIKADASELGYKRVGDTYYDDGFEKQLLMVCLDPSAKASTRRVRSAISRRYVDSGQTLTPVISMGRGSLSHHILSFQSKVDEIVRDGGEILLADIDIDLVAVGGAYKVLLPVNGQEKRGASKKGVALESPEENHRHVVLTDSRRSGCMFACDCAYSESAGSLVSLIRTSTIGQISRIRLLYTDNSAMFDAQSLWRELLGLEALSGDPMRRLFGISAFYGNSPKTSIVLIMQRIRLEFIATRGGNRS